MSILPSRCNGITEGFVCVCVWNLKSWSQNVYRWTKTLGEKQWAPTTRIHWSCCLVCCMWSWLGLMERWNGHLQAQLQYQLGDNTQWSSVAVLQDVVHALIKRALCGAVSPQTRKHACRNQEVQVEVSCMPNFRWKEFYSLSKQSGTLGLEILVVMGWVLLSENWQKVEAKTTLCLIWPFMGLSQ